MWDKVLTGIGFIVFALIVYGVLVLVLTNDAEIVK